MRLVLECGAGTMVVPVCNEDSPNIVQRVDFVDVQ